MNDFKSSTFSWNFMPGDTYFIPGEDFLFLLDPQMNPWSK